MLHIYRNSSLLRTLLHSTTHIFDGMYKLVKYIPTTFLQIHNKRINIYKSQLLKSVFAEKSNAISGIRIMIH